MELITQIANQMETANFKFEVNQNEVTNNYKFIKGKLVLVNREPDGDSVAFIPDHVEYFKDVYRGYMLKPSPLNGSVQLRFEGLSGITLWKFLTAFWFGSKRFPSKKYIKLCNNIPRKAWLSRVKNPSHKFNRVIIKYVETSMVPGGISHCLPLST